MNNCTAVEGTSATQAVNRGTGCLLYEALFLPQVPSGWLVTVPPSFLRTVACIACTQPESSALSLQVTQKFPLVIVQGHLVSEGVLLFGHQHFYLCENFTLSPTGDVYCTRHCLSK